MNIKNLVLVGIVVIAGGAAFVYFDPMGLDLLGSKKSTTVAQPVVPPRASTAAKPAVAGPKAAQTNAPVAAAPAAPSPTAKPVVAPAPALTPVVAAPVATPSVASPAQAIEPPLKLAKTITTEKKPTQTGQPGSKATGKPERAKNLDLRHCLELETDAAIAKCAGE